MVECKSPKMMKRKHRKTFEWFYRKIITKTKQNKTQRVSLSSWYRRVCMFCVVNEREKLHLCITFAIMAWQMKSEKARRRSASTILGYFPSLSGICSSVQPGRSWRPVSGRVLDSPPTHLPTYLIWPLTCPTDTLDHHVLRSGKQEDNNRQFYNFCHILTVVCCCDRRVGKAEFHQSKPHDEGTCSKPV